MMGILPASRFGSRSQGPPLGSSASATGARGASGASRVCLRMGLPSAVFIPVLAHVVSTVLQGIAGPRTALWFVSPSLSIRMLLAHLSICRFPMTYKVKPRKWSLYMTLSSAALPLPHSKMLRQQPHISLHSSRWPTSAKGHDRMWSWVKPEPNLSLSLV
jgi:hypothetical protein